MQTKTRSPLKTWSLRLVLVALVLAALAVAYGYYQYRAAGFGRTPVYETEAPVLPELKHPAVLVFSKTGSFIHKEAIPAAEALLQELGDKNGWSIYVTENGAIHNPQDLAKFDAIIWNNVTGDVLTAPQQQAMIDYIQAGGGWVGLHGTGDSSSSWDWLNDTLIGARFNNHPYPEQFQQATLHIENRSDPIVSHLDPQWVRVDEWYSFTESPRHKGIQILATLDESTYSPDFRGKDISMGEDHPIIWKHCVGQGRALYSAPGHTAESYKEPGYVTLLERAVAWSAGLEGNECGSAAVSAPALAPDQKTPK